jgi:two-component system NtrC family sensor kinase
MKGKILLLLLLLSIFSQAQNNVVLDSLIEAFETGPKDEYALSLLRKICVEHPNSTGRLLYANELLRLSEYHQIPEYVHYAYMEVGISYRMQGNLSESTRNLFKSLEIAKEIGDNKKIGEAYGELSTTFGNQGDTRNAVIYINRAIDIFREEKDSLNLCIALFNTGYDYHTMSLEDSAMMYYAEAEIIAEKSNIDPEIQKSFLAYIRGNRGITQGALGRYEEAIQSIENTILALKELNDRQAIVDYEYHLARILHHSGKTDEAMVIAKRALLESSVLNIKNTMGDVSLLIYRMYLSQQDYKSALKYRLTHEAIKDSIQNANVIREMALQHTQYEVGLKQAEVDLLDAQRRNQIIVNTALGAILVLAIITALLLYGYYRQKSQLSIHLEKKREQLESINKTKDKLFSIISHDLRGPVTAFSGLSRIVRFYVITNKTQELLELAGHMEDSATKLNNMLENLLAWSIQEQGQLQLKPEIISLEKISKDLISTYQAMVDEKNITLKMSCEPIAVEADWNTLHTAIRNLLGNAIKFTPEGGNISLTCYQDQGQAIIKVQDDGLGISRQKLDHLFELDSSGTNTFGTKGEKGLGLGLKIVHEFVHLNNGTISVSSDLNKGTTFTISIRLANIPTEMDLIA